MPSSSAGEQGVCRVGEAIFLAISVYGLGICVAFLAALLIRAIVAVLARHNGAAAPTQSAPSAAPPPTAPASAATSAIPTDDLVAVFAAVQSVLGSVRVVSVEPAGRPSTSNDLVAIAAAVQATFGNQRIVSVASVNS
ncbi:hypothetical protein [Consotaella salsifontis]|uniref:Oxaloacetate decarboxylase, gamma chain n=1 Tax=Consotaella salsifontis TaxID=1365950 RepID=A0A1T4LMP8_9HYPH|nr:hypothetical protein [Consotaella salsifontis]SJZ55995.1 hypothetical protein SAMN05428963_101285 [Consotaella salsifontis]